MIKIVKSKMAWLPPYATSRLARGFSLGTLGPVEARVLYDFSIASIAIIFSSLYIAWLRDQRPSILLALAPLLLILSNAALGIYTRLKRASGRTKALVLFASVVFDASLLAWMTHSLASPLLWVLLAYAPLAVVRVVLAIPYRKHTSLRAIEVRRHGPVLVIGGAGYIGSHTVDLLLAAGARVRVLDRLMYGRKSLAEFESHPSFELIEGDATEIAKLTNAMRDASAVVYLSGLVGDPACAVDGDFTRHANIIATRMAKDVAQSLGVSRFIFASSCSVYGVTSNEVNEQDALNPASLYAQTKIDSEKELLFSVPDDFFVTVLRFATVFGHSRRPRFDLVANLFTAQAMTDGLITVLGPQQWRPFIHVRDLAHSILTVLDADPAKIQSQIFNIGDNRLNMTILQLAETVKNVVEAYHPVDVSIQEVVADRRNYAVSFQKAERTLGFRAKTLLEEGISEMAANFRSGVYESYRTELYSNVAITRRAAVTFHDPAEASKLYAPLGGM